MTNLTVILLGIFYVKRRRSRIDIDQILVVLNKTCSIARRGAIPFCIVLHSYVTELGQIFQNNSEV